MLSYVLAAPERLDKMATLVKGNLDKAQRVQERWYDRNARQREFKVGDNVLVLLPMATNKLLAKCKGNKAFVYGYRLIDERCPLTRNTRVKYGIPYSSFTVPFNTVYAQISHGLYR